MRSKFNFNIKYENGERIDLHEQDLWVSSFRILSPSSEYTTEKVEGADGVINKGSSKNARQINTAIQINGYDPEDFDLIRDKVFYLFRPGEELEITRDLQPGKKITCVVDGSFDIDYEGMEDGEFTVNFTMFKPYLESIGTTQDIDANGISATSALWGFGMGLISDDESLKYNHNTKTFKIYNAGTQRIHPFNHHQKLIITISNVTGSTDHFQLKNNTNGSVFKINEGVTNSQTIVIDGPNITSNGLQYLKKTNKQYIELDIGWNEFTVTGASQFSILFDFPFYYL